MHLWNTAGFFTTDRIARLLLAVFAMTAVLSPTPSAWAAETSGGGSSSGPYFGAGNLPPGCAGDMVPGTPEYWIVPGEGGLTGGESSSQAVCHHMRTDMNFLDSPEVDVLILVPLTAEVEREMRQARQSIAMWEQGIDYLAEDMGLQWLADGMNFHVTVDYFDPSGEGGEFTTYPIVDPELVIVQGINPAGHVGIGIDPVGSFVTGGSDFCHGIPNALDIEQWENLPGFDRHHEERGGNYREDCGGEGGNICFAVNSRMPSAFGAEAMFDLVSHEVGHCLSIGHVGDGAEGAWGGLPPDDIMAYAEGGAGAKCVSTLDVEGIALRMSRYLDVNGDGTVDAADELQANDQVGEGGNPFQVQHPRDHYYASSTGEAIDCPQPDMGLVPGARTNWTPQRADVELVPTLKVDTPTDGAIVNDGNVTVAGSVDHVEAVEEGPTESAARVDDPDDDATSPITEVLHVDAEITADAVTATIQLADIWASTDVASPVSYSIVVDGRKFDSFVRYAVDPNPMTWDNAAAAYMPAGTSTWDLDDKTVSFVIPRDYLTAADIVAPYQISASANFGALSNTTVDDRAPGGNETVGLAAPSALRAGFVPFSQHASTVNFEHDGPYGNTFYAEESTAGTGRDRRFLGDLAETGDISGMHLFSLAVPQVSDVTFRVDWTDPNAVTDLDLFVTGAADSASEGATATDGPDDLFEQIALQNVVGTLDIALEPYLVSDTLDGSTYTLTATVTPVDSGPDTDGDGIPDSQDACPTEAGPAATAGCPDTDGDGVPDKDDVCPTIAGAGADGCPIESTEFVKVFVDGVFAAQQAVDTSASADTFSVDVAIDAGAHTVRVDWIDDGAVLASESRAVTFEDLGTVVSASTSSVQEAAGATLDLQLNLSAASDDEVALRVRTADGTAAAGVDYVAIDTTVAFAPGQQTRMVQVDVLDDDLAEATETVDFIVEVLAGNAVFGNGTTSLTLSASILDAADQPVPDPSVTITSVDGATPGRHFTSLGTAIAIEGDAVIPVVEEEEEEETNGALVVDAGNSAYVQEGDLATLLGVAYEGVGPFSFAWTYDGANDRFATPNAMETTFDTTGLSQGLHEVRLTVIDGGTSPSTVGSDTVLVAVAGTTMQEVFSSDGSVLVGTAGSFLYYGQDFTIADGVDQMRVELAFEEATGFEDLDLQLWGPSATRVDTGQGTTSANPEVIEIDAPAAGAWEGRVFGGIAANTPFTVSVLATSTAPDPRPVVTLPPSFDFEVGEAQVLNGSVAGGTAPVLLEWDINGDGVTDGEGSSITTGFGAGQHLVSLKATDALGLEHRVMTAVRVGTGSSEAPGIVVISITDSGINPYHLDFSASEYPDPQVKALTGNFTKHPSTYLPGFPANAEALPLTIDGAYNAAQDSALFDAMAYNKLYWIPGTKIIGAYDAGSDNDQNFLDENSHGTRSASLAAGNIYGFCPSCLLAIGEGFASDDYFNVQSWVDLSSNSWGNRANVGFTPVLDNPAQPKASAEGGQIALYASGNGAGNAFVVPIQTYLPPMVGPDWQVRVGAAHADRDQAVLGDGNPVDVTSFGMGSIPAADIGGVTKSANHSGTSAATPYTAGALGEALRQARALMGDATNGWSGGAVATGNGVGTAAMADGVLTRKELLEAFFKTARPSTNTGLYVPVQATVPATADAYLFEGYGLIDNRHPDVEQRSSSLTLRVLLGEDTMPDRSVEDAFFREYDEPIRDFLWGNYSDEADPDTGGETPITAYGPASLTSLGVALGDGTLASTLDWMVENIGPLPTAFSSTGDSGAAGAGGVPPGTTVQAALVRAGVDPANDDWQSVQDTSDDGDLSTWALATDADALGEFELHARVVRPDGSSAAVDGPYSVFVEIPFDAACPPYNTLVGEDLAGDAILFDTQGLPSELSNPALDVRSLDISTNADGSVNFTLGVEDLGEDYSGVGERWGIEFTANRTAFELVAQRSLRDDTGLFVVDPTFMLVQGVAEAAVTGSLDATSDEIRFTVPVDVFDGQYAEAFAAGSEISVSVASGNRDNFTGYHAADELTSNGCRFFVGQDVIVPATVTIADATVSEDGSTVALDLLLDRRAFGREDVLVSTADGTATAGQDYMALVDEVVAFGDRDTQATITVDLLDDAVFDGDETFEVVLSAGTETAVGGSGRATVTIVENDPLPTIAVDGATAEEGTDPALEVVLTLPYPAPREIRVAAATVTTGAAGEATPGEDHEVVDLVATFAPGATTATVAIPVLDDDVSERNEVVLLDLEVLSDNATFADGPSTRVVNTITDMPDRVTPTVAITGGTVDEPAVGDVAPLTWTVEVAGDVWEPIVVDVELGTQGSATAADHDGTLSTTRLTFDAPGVQTVSLGIVGDDVVEGDETVALQVVNGAVDGAELAGAPHALATIVDTTVPPTPTASIADASVVEGDGGRTTAVFVVSLDRPAPQDVALVASTAYGSADKKDFKARTDVPVLIPAGATSTEFHVSVKGDDRVETDEDFTVSLSAVSGAEVADGEAVGTIQNDDLPVASVRSFSIRESTAGHLGAVRVEVKLDQAPVETATVRVATLGDVGGPAATLGEDYEAVDTVLTFAPGQRVATFDLVIHDDDVEERDWEYVLYGLSEADGLEIGRGIGLVLIRDDD